MDNTGVDVSSKPREDVSALDSSLVRVELELDLNKARLTLDEDINEVVLLQEIEQYTLRWKDSRIKTTECAGAVGQMLSMTREDAKSDIARQSKRINRNRFWIPQLAAEDLVPGFDVWDDRTAFALGSTASLDDRTPRAAPPAARAARPTPPRPGGRRAPWAICGRA